MVDKKKMVRILAAISPRGKVIIWDTNCFSPAIFAESDSIGLLKIKNLAD